MNVQRRQWLRGGMLVGGVLLSCALWAAEPSPEAVIRQTAEEVIATVKADKSIQAGDRNKAYALINQKVLPHFDFARMTRLAMGRNWNQATGDQQKVIADDFKDLLVRTYSSSLSQYKDQVLQVKGSEVQASEGEAVVHTVLVPSGGQNIPIDYSMEQQGNDWKVYDIKVDGVSLVTNYRGEFSDIVRRNGIDGLIQALEQKRKAAQSK